MNLPQFHLELELSALEGAKAAKLAEAPQAAAETLAGFPTLADRDGEHTFSWRAYFEERAAIREFDGESPRAEAEVGALMDCIARWRALNPFPASGDDACVHCREAKPDMPMVARGGHAWLHRSCWEPMNRARDTQAREAVLAALAIDLQC